MQIIQIINKWIDDFSREIVEIPESVIRWICHFYIYGQALLLASYSVIAKDSVFKHWELGSHLTQKDLDGTSCGEVIVRFFFSQYGMDSL